MNFQDEHIVVTGSAGFIGSHLCERLLTLGARVTGIDNFDPYYAKEKKLSNLNEIAQHQHADRFQNHEFDICDQDQLVDLFSEQSISGIVHLAAKAGVRPSIADPAGYTKANVLGTQSILSAATKSGCKRVVCASSSSVYGNNTKVPFSETDMVNDPISPYAATKRACEIIGYTHHHLTAMPIAMLRFFTVFGPRQRPDLAMSLFMKKIRDGEPIQQFGDGTTSRDYTFIDDIITGIVHSYTNIDAHGYRVWNLGGNHPVTLNEMIHTIAQVVGREPVIEQREMQPGDVNRTWADLERSKDELGYQPTTSIQEGLEHQWAWMNTSPALRD